MKISLLIPCHNEEKGLRKCLESALVQTRPLDQIVVVNDGSTDGTQKILASFASEHAVIHAINLVINTGNKSKAQEAGLPSVTGDVVVMTDADTIIDEHFVERIEAAFLSDEKREVGAVGGYVCSLKHNWLTACRAIDYIVGQGIFKKAQSIINYMFVMPGCATAMRTEVLRGLSFNHDTVTEDLDFTFQLHLKGLKIIYAEDAKVYTQDPPNLPSYIRQMRRWYGGGWQNIRKYYPIVFHRPAAAFELSCIFLDGVFYSMLLFIMPLANPKAFFTFILPMYFLNAFLFALYASIKGHRYELLLFFPAYVLIVFINAFIISTEFVKEIVLNRRDLVWQKVDRVSF
ncbi:MAG: glycosyltransferase family 2 protein [Candidatus Moranbacteria bacterium]|nr:glycosyltransferase family 2 protein [Candidatus Moranbacteria bacterium]